MEALRHNKKVVIIGAGIALIFLIVLFMPGTGGVPIIGEVPPRFIDQEYMGGTSIHSDDGQARIDIPENATLSEGTIGDVSIRLVDPFEVFGPGEYVEGPAYELLPEGLTFSEPVTVLIEGFTVSDTIPLILHRSEGNVEFLSPAGIVIDQSRGTYTLALEVDHFSTVGVDSKHGIFKYELTSGGSANIGESLPFKLKVTVDPSTFWFDVKGGYNSSKAEDYSGEGHYYRFASGGWYSIKPWEINNSWDVLSPKEIKVPGKENLKEKDVYAYETNLTCAKEGSENPSINDLDVEFRIQNQGLRNGASFKNFSTAKTDFTIIPNSYECKSKVKSRVGGGSDTLQPGGDFVLIGPPYTVICDNGTSFSGYYKIDKNGNVIIDSVGNKLDSETGKPVVCAGGGKGLDRQNTSGGGNLDPPVMLQDTSRGGSIETGTTTMPKSPVDLR